MPHGNESRLEAAVREVERLQREKKQDRDRFVARASSTDPEAHVMRNGEGGTVPSYNVQLLTDTTHGLVVNVEATTDAVDHRQLEPALDRCAKRWDAIPNRWWPTATTPITPRSQVAADHGVDFYGSWQESWRAGERDAHGRSAAFLASAFPYDAEQDCFTCPAGETLTHHAILNREHGVRTHVYRAPRKACRNCALRNQCAPQTARPACGAPSRASRNPRRRWRSSPRWPPRKQNKFTVNARASPSSRTPGLKSAAACASSAVEAA